MRALLALVCLAACSTPPPRVVTVVVPYVAIIPLDSATEADAGIIGATRCDLAGHPYISVSLNLPPARRQSVLWHESVHVAQVQSYGSCRDFVARYMADSVFRLTIEADSYCAVYLTQRKLKLELDPDHEGIISRLRFRLRAEWSREAVLAVMPC